MDDFLLIFKNTPAVLLGIFTGKEELAVKKVGVVGGL